jgi:hypothetical protein
VIPTTPHKQIKRVKQIQKHSRVQTSQQLEHLGIQYQATLKLGMVQLGRQQIQRRLTTQPQVQQFVDIYARADILGIQVPAIKIVQHKS